MSSFLSSLMRPNNDNNNNNYGYNNNDNIRAPPTLSSSVSSKSGLPSFHLPSFPSLPFSMRPDQNSSIILNASITTTQPTQTTSSSSSHTHSHSDSLTPTDIRSPSNRHSSNNNIILPLSQTSSWLRLMELSLSQGILGSHNQELDGVDTADLNLIYSLFSSVLSSPLFQSYTSQSLPLSFSHSFLLTPLAHYLSHHLTYTQLTPLAAMMHTNIQQHFATIFKYSESPHVAYDAYLSLSLFSARSSLLSLILHTHYPRLMHIGYNTLSTNPPVIYLSSSSPFTSHLDQLSYDLMLPKSTFKIIPIMKSKTDSGNEGGLDIYEIDLISLEREIVNDKANGRKPIAIIASMGVHVLIQAQQYYSNNKNITSNDPNKNESVPKTTIPNAVTTVDTNTPQFSSSTTVISPLPPTGSTPKSSSTSIFSSVPNSTATEIDALPSLFSLCENFNIWLHVEGSLPLLSAASSCPSSIARVWQYADSVCLDQTMGWFAATPPPIVMLIRAAHVNHTTNAIYKAGSYHASNTGKPNNNNNSNASATNIGNITSLPLTPSSSSSSSASSSSVNLPYLTAPLRESFPSLLLLWYQFISRHHDHLPKLIEHSLQLTRYLHFSLVNLSTPVFIAPSAQYLVTKQMAHPQLPHHLFFQILPPPNLNLEELNLNTDKLNWYLYQRLGSRVNRKETQHEIQPQSQHSPNQSHHSQIERLIPVDKESTNSIREKSDHSMDSALSSSLVEPLHSLFATTLSQSLHLGRQGFSFCLLHSSPLPSSLIASASSASMDTLSAHISHELYLLSLCMPLRPLLVEELRKYREIKLLPVSSLIPISGPMVGLAIIQYEPSFQLSLEHKNTLNNILATSLAKKNSIFAPSTTIDHTVCTVIQSSDILIRTDAVAVIVHTIQDTILKMQLPSSIQAELSKAIVKGIKEAEERLHDHANQTTSSSFPMLGSIFSWLGAGRSISSPDITNSILASGGGKDNSELLELGHSYDIRSQSLSKVQFNGKAKVPTTDQPQQQQQLGAEAVGKNSKKAEPIPLGGSNNAFDKDSAHSATSVSSVGENGSDPAPASPIEQTNKSQSTNKFATEEPKDSSHAPSSPNPIINANGNNPL